MRIGAITARKTEAIRLRRKGKSYNEISHLLGVGKGTLNYWFRDINWSRSIRKQLEERARRLQRENLIRLNALKKQKWERFYAQAHEEANRQYAKLKQSHLFIAGLMLYWGEGDKGKRNGLVRMTNADPRMLKLFIRFLEKICQVKKEKIRVHLLLYPDLDIKKCLEYWSKELDLTLEYFNKSVVIPGRHKSRRLTYGLCSVHTSGTYLKKKILVWLDLVSRDSDAGVV